MNSLFVMILSWSPCVLTFAIGFLAGRFFSRAARSFFSSTAEPSRSAAANIARQGKGVSAKLVGGIVP